MLATKDQNHKAEFMRCAYNEVNRIIHLSTKKGMESRKLNSIVFEHLRIDEESFKKMVSIPCRAKPSYLCPYYGIRKRQDNKEI